MEKSSPSIYRDVHDLTEARSLSEHSCAILSLLKIMSIFNNTSAAIKTKSFDVLLNVIILLSELSRGRATVFFLEMNGI